MPRCRGPAGRPTASPWLTSLVTSSCASIWDPDRRVTITADLVHDNAGYTPYAGRQLQGWPATVLSRGQTIVQDGKLDADRGRGRFIPRVLSDAAVPSGLKVPEMAQLDAWGTPLKL